jgi:hypothetical protein
VPQDGAGHDPEKACPQPGWLVAPIFPEPTIWRVIFPRRRPCFRLGAIAFNIITLTVTDHAVAAHLALGV